MSDNHKTLHIIVKGKVQGVGFRASIKHCAETLDIAGSVKNLSGNDVEVYAQGEPEKLKAFVQEVKKGTKLAQIEHVVVEDYPAKKDFTSFDILF